MTKFNQLNTEELRIRKKIQKGSHLSIMLLGSKGTGKSTFLNNLCGTDMFPTMPMKENYQDAACAHISPKLVEIKENLCITEGSGSKIVLDILLFQGVGDNLDNTKSADLIRTYLQEQFDSILTRENQVSRNPKENDPRPHVCLYFLKPNSRGLKEFDIKMMKAIEDYVNIIPVISKIDTLTTEELRYNKEMVMETIRNNNIKIFDFKDDLLLDNLAITDNDKACRYFKDKNFSPKISNILPFGLICSNEVSIEENGTSHYVRNFDWGSVFVDDIENSDFLYLRSILFGSHFQDFKDTTENVLYENYRTDKLLREKESINSFTTNDSNSWMNQQNVTFPKSHHLKSHSADIELKEKNRIIEAYQKKITELERQILTKKNDFKTSNRN